MVIYKEETNKTRWISWRSCNPFKPKITIYFSLPRSVSIATRRHAGSRFNIIIFRYKLSSLTNLTAIDQIIIHQVLIIGFEWRPKFVFLIVLAPRISPVFLFRISFPTTQTRRTQIKTSYNKNHHRSTITFDNLCGSIIYHTVYTNKRINNDKYNRAEVSDSNKYETLFQAYRTIN